jgi:hypothetical protein
LAALAKELIQANVDVIVTSGHPSFRAAQLVSKTILIVVAVMSDPVQKVRLVGYPDTEP